MPQKRRLPAEEKIRLVEKYLAGEMGISEIKVRYGIKHQTLYEWVRSYKARGAMGLSENGSKRKYELSLKQQAVEEYPVGQGLLRDIVSSWGRRKACSLLSFVICLK